MTRYCPRQKRCSPAARVFTLAAITLVVAASKVGAQNLLTNGDFEQNDRRTYTNYYSADDLAYIPLADTVPGWTFSHSVDLYGPIHDPQNGAQYLDLVGGGPLTATYAVQQSFATVIGSLYSLSFYYGNNENLSAAQATFTAALTDPIGTIWTQDFSHTGDTISAHDWTLFSTTFVATSATTTLSFTDTSHFATSYDPNYTVGGATLDNVQVVAAVPEAGNALAGLFAVGVAIFACRRRWPRAPRVSAKRA